MFYNVIVIHPDTEPMTTPKDVYESAVALYTSECRNAAGYLTNKPGKEVSVYLNKPDGTTDRHMIIQS